MKVYALTGGIASGKSEASRHFESLGIPVIDADVVAHRVMDPGGHAYQGVIDAFGDDILTGEKIDREKLGAIVFNDREKLDTLNGLVHPAVQIAIAEALAALAGDGKEIAIVDAALHAENGKLGEGMAGLILVDAPESERIRRMVELRELTQEEAAIRIASQTPPATKRPLANWIIENDGTIEALREQVARVADEIRS